VIHTNKYIRWFAFAAVAFWLFIARLSLFHQHEYPDSHGESGNVHTHSESDQENRNHRPPFPEDEFCPVCRFLTSKWMASNFHYVERIQYFVTFIEIGLQTAPVLAPLDLPFTRGPPSSI